MAHLIWISENGRLVHQANFVHSNWQQGMFVVLFACVNHDNSGKIEYGYCCDQMIARPVHTFEMNMHVSQLCAIFELVEYSADLLPVSCEYQNQSSASAWPLRIDICAGVEDAKRILYAEDSTCPQCDNVLTKRYCGSQASCINKRVVHKRLAVQYPASLQPSLCIPEVWSLK